MPLPDIVNTERARATIVVVDDDPDLLRLMQIRLSAAGYNVITCGSAERALAQLTVVRPQLVVTDLRMDGMDGMSLFEAISARNPALPVIVLTAHGTIPDAVDAVKRGVFGYLTKPFDAKTLLAEIERALLVSGIKPGTGVVEDRHWRSDIITRNQGMEDMLAKAQLVAQNDASVLICGESGTGKELLARAIHRASSRHAQPFVAINCGAIPEPLLESELFGYVKGAFTGATRDYKGLFVAANHGTLLLDEIGDMPVPLQVKLLRVLQEHEVRPLGSAEHHKIDVRIISASHRNVEAEMASGNFREDLYYRLNVVSLALPPLDERRDDIPLLVNGFLDELARKYGKTLSGYAPEAMEMLITAVWPGNVRQLRNVVEQSVALAMTPVIPASLLQQALRQHQGQYTSYEEARREFERDYLARLLKVTGGNVAQASRLARRNRTEFYKLLQRHQLESSLFRPARQSVNS
jgi:two-component system, NtrC family, response regulator GlrR